MTTSHTTQWTVIGECLPRHRAREFLRFLRHIDRAVLAHLDVHVICVLPNLMAGRQVPAVTDLC